MRINRDIVEYSGNTEIITEAYGLTNIALIADILSNMYSDPIMAVIREYVANALDSHFMAGKAHVPIRVIIPNINHLFFEVHDFGLGLDNIEVKRLWRYGDSDKNHTDDVIGGFGIGSKAGFSYTNNYEIVATKNGVKRSYITFKNEQGPLTELISEEATDEGNGVIIKIPVKATDINAFREKAQAMLKWLEVQPEVIGMKIEAVQYEIKGEDYFILKNNSSKIFIKMGNVVYDSELYSDGFDRDIVLTYPIGAFRVAPSRENIIVKTEDQDIIQEKVKEIYKLESERINRELKREKSLYRAYQLHKKLNDIFQYEQDFNWKGRDSYAVPLAKAIARGRGKSLKIYPDIKRIGIDQIKYIYDTEGNKKYLDVFKESSFNTHSFGSNDYILVIDTSNPKQALRDWLAAGRPEVPFVRYSEIVKPHVAKSYDRKPVMLKGYSVIKHKVTNDVEIDINDGYPYKYVNCRFNQFLGVSIFDKKFNLLVQNAGIRDNFLIVPSTLSKSLPGNWQCLDQVFKDAMDQVRELYDDIFMKNLLLSNPKFREVKQIIDTKKKHNINLKGFNSDWIETLFGVNDDLSPEESVILLVGKDVLNITKDDWNIRLKYNNLFNKVVGRLDNHYPLLRSKYRAFVEPDKTVLQYIDLMNKHVYNMGN